MGCEIVLPHLGRQDFPYKQSGIWVLYFFILTPGSHAEIKQQSEKTAGCKKLYFKPTATNSHLNQTSDTTSKSPGYLKASSWVAQNAVILYLLLYKDATIAQT